MSYSALPFEGRVGPRCLDKKLRVHVTLPHPARCIFRRLFTNSDGVLEQARGGSQTPRDGKASANLLVFPRGDRR